MNVVFLDYDGIVNTPIWDKETGRCKYGYPSDNKVNNYQACQWLSEFCEKYNYDIVVTSTWRLDDNYIDCLYNGGLRKSIKVLGRTALLENREKEILDYLNNHKEIEKFIVVDDEFVGKSLRRHTVITRGDVGFNEEEFLACRRLDEKL